MTKQKAIPTAGGTLEEDQTKFMRKRPNGSIQKAASASKPGFPNQHTTKK